MMFIIVSKMGLLDKQNTAPPSPGAPGGTPGQGPTIPQSQASPLGGFFTKKSAPAPMPTGSNKELTDTVMNLARRLRMLESRNDNMRKKVQFIEQNMLENQKKLTMELKAQQLEMLEVKGGFLEMQSRVRMLVKEIQMRAAKEDVDVLKKYLSFWEPIKFVTVDQVDQIIDEKLRKSTDL